MLTITVHITMDERPCQCLRPSCGTAYEVVHWTNNTASGIAYTANSMPLRSNGVDHAVFP